jgi:hypothetical protein
MYCLARTITLLLVDVGSCWCILALVSVVLLSRRIPPLRLLESKAVLGILDSLSNSSFETNGEYSPLFGLKWRVLGMGI